MSGLLTWVDGDAVTAPEDDAVRDELELYVDDDPSSSFTTRRSPSSTSARSATPGSR